MSDFDHYHTWLGIRPEDQPANLYRLLGLSLFESDLDVIRSATERQSLHVRRLARGEFTEIGQQLLNELAQAKLTLSDPAKREAYDSNLKQQTHIPNDGGHFGGDVINASPDAMDESPRNTLEEIEEFEPIDSQATDPRDATIAKIASVTISRTPKQVTYLDLAAHGVEGAEKKQWVVGYHSECDFRIEGATISGMHCKITLASHQVLISDLNSTNGTYINQERIQNTKRLGCLDLLTLGRDHRVILPERMLHDEELPEAQVYFIGKGEGNECQLESRVVSTFHARVIHNDQRLIVEDLGSRNGTFLSRDQSPEIRITRKSVRHDDKIRFADRTFSGRELWAFGKKLT